MALAVPRCSEIHRHQITRLTQRFGAVRTVKAAIGLLRALRILNQTAYDRRFRSGDRDVMAPYLGSCLCGRVSYQMLSSPKAVTHCHCKQCQKSHGAAFATYGAVPRKDLCILAGDEAIQSFSSSETVFRQFCRHCGSSLFWSTQTGDWDDWICVALGTLDSPFTALKQKHLHLESQPFWSPFPASCSRGGATY